MDFDILSTNERDLKRNLSLLTAKDDVNYVATSKSLVSYDETNGHVDIPSFEVELAKKKFSIWKKCVIATKKRLILLPNRICIHAIDAECQHRQVFFVEDRCLLLFI